MSKITSMQSPEALASAPDRDGGVDVDMMLEEMSPSALRRVLTQTILEFPAVQGIVEDEFLRDSDGLNVPDSRDVAELGTAEYIPLSTREPEDGFGDGEYSATEGEKGEVAKRTRERAFSFERTGRMEQWLVDYEELSIGMEIGSGAFSTIHLCDWRRSKVVVKRLKKSTSDKEIISEIEVLRTTRHPNIVMFLGASISKQTNEIVMIMEHVDGVTLLEWLKYRHSRRTLYRVAEQLAQVLNFCHSCNPPIIYRDLKPSNIMISGKNHLKLLDFGLSKFTVGKGNAPYRMTGNTGSQRFMSPEVAADRHYDLSADVYSFGLVLYCIFAGDLPFAGPHTAAVLKKFRSGDSRALKTAELISEPALRILISQCTSVDPNQRPSMEVVCDQISMLRQRSSTCVSCFCF